MISMLSFTDDEPIYDRLGMTIIVDNAKELLFSTIQNMSRTLLAQDNGKKLRCVAVHPALSSHNNEVSRQLDIKCKSKYYGLNILLNKLNFMNNIILIVYNHINLFGN